MDELLLGRRVGAGADQLSPPSVERLSWMRSAQRLRNRPSSEPSSSSTTLMCTAPTLSGTSASRHVRPSSSEILTTLGVLLVATLRASPPTESATSSASLRDRIREAIDGIVLPDVSLHVRGNLYTVLLGLIRYASVVLSSSAGADASFSDTASVKSMASTTRAGSGRQDQTIATAFLPKLDRLLHVIARDAVVGSEESQTIAFTLLATLLDQAARIGSEGKMIQLLAKNGYLQTFVHSLRDAQPDLVSACGSDPRA